MLNQVNKQLSLPAMRMLYGVDDIEDQRDAAVTGRQPDKAAIECVYYVAVGKHVKIGYTRNLKQRMMAYPSGDLLCREDGGLEIERQRHREFAEYLDRGHEWFLRGPRLIAHIDALTEQPSK